MPDELDELIERARVHAPGEPIPPDNFEGNGRDPAAAEHGQEKEKRRILAAEYVQVLKGMGYTFKMLELDQSIEVNAEKISDPLESKIKAQLRDAGYSQVNVARDAYIADAYDHQYHPIKDYLDEALSVWDGQDHIKKLADHFADSDGVFPVYLRKWLIGAVARVYRRNVRNTVLVLDGPQSIGKSYFVKWLCPLHLLKYQRESGIQPDSKDHMIALWNTWIWEIAELGSTTRRADLEALKFFLSLMDVTERPSYGRYALTRPALTSFVATVNSDGAGFLNDPTGSSRFMTASLGYIAWEYARAIERDQVWGQARALFDRGEDWRLTGEIAEQAARINKRFERTSPVEYYLDECLEIQTPEEITRDGYWFMPSREALDRLKTLEVKETERGMAIAVSQYLKTRGINLQPYWCKKDGKSIKVKGYKGVRLAPSFTKPEPDREPGDDERE